MLQPGVIGYARDWPFPFYREQFILWAHQNLSPYIEYAGGFPQTLIASYWIPFILSVFAKLGMGADLISKITCFSVLIASGASLYYLTRVIGTRKSSSLVAGLFYMVTPNVFGRFLEGHIVYLISYALSPFVLALFIRSVDSPSKSYKQIVFAGLIYGLAWAQGQFAFMLFGLILLYVLFTTNVDEFKVKIKMFLVVNLIAVFIQLTSLLSLSFAPGELRTLTSTTPLSFLGRFKQLSSTLINAFTLRGYLPQSRYYNGIIIPNFAWTILGLMLPLCAIITLLLNRQNRRIRYFSLYFGLLILISLFILTGANQPLGNLKIWALLNIPLGIVLEDPYHFAFISSLAYAALLAVFSDYLMDNLSKVREIGIFATTTKTASIKIGMKLTTRRSQFVVLVVLLSLIALSAIPFFTGNLNGAVQVYNPPSYYKEIYNYFATMNGDFRVAWVPLSSVGISRYSSIQPVRDPMVTLFSKPSLDVATFRWHKFFTFMARTIGENRTKYFGQLLGITNVKYIITRNDFIPFYASISNQTSLMSKQERILLIKNFGDLRVFENGLYLPHIYGMSKAVLVAGDLSTLVNLGYYLGNQTLPLVIFSSQLSPTNKNVLSAISSIVIQDDNYIDLLLPFIPSEYRIQPGLFATIHTSWQNGWTQSVTEASTANWHYYTQIEEVAISATDDILIIPFIAPTASQYVVYAKVFFGSKASNITFSIGNYSKTINAKVQCDKGFKWVDLGSVSLSKGGYTFKVSSQKGENAIGLIVIAPKDVWLNAQASASKFLAMKPVIIISKSQNLLDEGLVTVSNRLGSEVSEGMIMETLAPTSVNFTVWAPFSGVYDIYLRTNSPSSISATMSTFYFKLVDGFENISGWHQTGDPTGMVGQSTFTPHISLSSFSISYSFIINKSSTSAFILSKEFSSEDWSQFNAVGFWVYPQVNVSTAYLYFGLRNEVDQWYGDFYYLPANQWSYISIDMSSWNRSRVNEVRLVMVGHQWGPYTNGQPVKLFFTDLTVLKKVVSTKFDWYPMGDILLKQGLNNISLSINQANLGLDLIVFKPSNQTTELYSVTLQSKISYTKLDSANYLIHVDNSEPFFLVFSENYDPSWHLVLNGQLINPFPAYGFANVYYINQTGRYELSLQYSFQYQHNLGKIVSFTTILTIIIFLVLPFNKLRRFRK
jgi:hypothetical protein